MQDSDRFNAILRRIDGRSYRAYKDIEGAYEFGTYSLHIDHVQGDPFAAPSRVRVRIPLCEAGFSECLFETKSREVAFRDFLTRRFADAADRTCRTRRGSGRSGLIAIDRPGQEILERTSVVLAGSSLEARFVVGLPAHGRRIAGIQATGMFFEDLPEIVRHSLFASALDREALLAHVEVAEDADALRNSLADRGLVAFVADGAVLPRASGVDDRPLEGESVVPFRSPSELRTAVKLPNRGEVTGMGISRGVTLIVGGGYHGKSTLLRAVERGIYNHIPGDGREFVVAAPGAVRIRAEDGRRIERVDISPFITNLPFRRDTTAFSTEDASGSTSQAANIMEALETGADVLLIDEDTSATNFMIRDHRMQELVAKEHEPITPFIDKVRSLSADRGVSTILVIGGSGDYFDVADTVICMHRYAPEDCTARARAIAEKYRAERRPEGGDRFGAFENRIPDRSGIDPSRGRREVKIAPKGTRTIAFGTQTIDLAAVEQLVDTSQTRAIGDAIQYATRYMDGTATLAEVVGRVSADIEREGLDLLSRHRIGDYALFRPQELAAAINRLRTFRAVQLTGPRSARR
jgi:predicted ABC-class ATPase